MRAATPPKPVIFPERLLSNREVLSLTGKSRSGLRDSVLAGRFPAPVRDGRRRRWLATEVAEWIATAAAARPPPASGNSSTATPLSLTS
jgi:predicted DNA-binding transcriptional regulator AlpA